MLYYSIYYSDAQQIQQKPICTPTFPPVILIWNSQPLKVKDLANFESQLNKNTLR